jgi:hypothetical protein
MELDHPITMKYMSLTNSKFDKLSGYKCFMFALKCTPENPESVTDYTIMNKL